MVPLDRIQNFHYNVIRTDVLHIYRSDETHLEESMKNITWKRSLSLLMALVMLLGTLLLTVSCGTGEEDPAKDSDSITTGEQETERPLA